MKGNEVTDKVLNIIKENFGDKKPRISSRFVEDLGADDLDMVEIVMALEEVFGVSGRGEERLRSGCTLGDLQEVLADRPEARFVLVGHEPDVSRMVGRLIGNARVKMQTSCVARVEAEQVEPGGGTLIWLLSPQVAGAE